jgi:hypothetical protein
MICTVQEDPESGELFIELPLELIEALNWSNVTSLAWTISSNNCVYLSEAK